MKERHIRRKTKQRLITCIILITTAVTATAQIDDDWEELMQEMTEELASGEDESSEWAAQLEELSDLHDHPLDINAATSEDLLRLPFLTEQQAQAIIDYRARYGRFYSLGELRLISALDYGQIRWLRQCLTVSAVTPQKRTSPYRGSKHELLTRFNIPLYKQAGWPWEQGISNQTRYQVQWGKHWDAGLRGEKDAGESMFTRDSPLWDSWGGHLMAKDLSIGQQAHLQTIIVGDFKASFGEGLVMNAGARLGKLQTNIWRTTSSLRPHRSADESRFLRGAAATVEFGKAWSLTVLYSFRKLDATLQKNNTVQSINTTGLHRTDAERARRGTLGSHTTSLHVSWQRGAWHAGATGLFQYTDHLFQQNNALYRQIYPEGYLFGATSADYGARFAHWTFKGETAYSAQRRGRGVATLNSATWRPSNDWQLTLIQRYYGKNYYSPHASAFGESSTVQNESGVCLLLEAHRLGAFSTTAFVDYFYSPWPRYTMTRYSQGFEGSLQMTWQPSQQQKAVLRYQVKSKERSDSRYYSHRWRAAYTYSLSNTWTASASTFLHHFMQPATDERSTGIALMPRIDYKPASSPISGSCAFVWFSTADYNSRLYFYEPTLTQVFGIQMLYGKGERFIATLRWHTGTYQDKCRFQLQLKAGITHYRDRNVISSGPTQINGSWKPDLLLLFRLNLR